MIFKKVFMLPLFLFFVMFLSGCTIPDIKFYMSDGFDSNKTNAEKNNVYFSTREAFAFLEPGIERTFLQVNARLGKIKGANFNKDGKASSWSFYYYSENKESKDYFNENKFEWSNNRPFTSSSKIFSKGYTSSEYDYLREDLGPNWLDSEDIIRKTVGFVPKVNLENISMELFWDTSISKLSPVWKVNTNLTESGQLIFNGITGERIH